VNHLHDIITKIKEKLGDSVRVSVRKLYVSKPSEITQLFLQENDCESSEESREVYTFDNNMVFCTHRSESGSGILVQQDSSYV
jgi:hypothetical protein